MVAPPASLSHGKTVGPRIWKRKTSGDVAQPAPKVMVVDIPLFLVFLMSQVLLEMKQPMPPPISGSLVLIMYLRHNKLIFINDLYRRNYLL